MLYAVVSVEIFVTYSRLAPEETYNVSRAGFGGGLSRALTFVNWPVALVALVILGLLAERLARRETTIVALVGVALCAAVFWPGMVKQSNLDARAANALPALGVFVAVVLTAIAFRRLAPPAPLQWQRWDGLRIAIAGIVLVLAVPWLAADVGVSFDGVPVLGTLYQTGEFRTEPGRAGAHPAVHAGHHHGMSGALLVWSALLLSRLVSAVARRWLRGVLAALLALMLCYGSGVLANDFWLEQIVKRGWTDWSIPNVNNPTLGAGWAVIVVATVALWLVTVWLRRRVIGSTPSAPSLGPANREHLRRSGHTSR